jgi:hypothetical protein
MRPITSALILGPVALFIQACRPAAQPAAPSASTAPLVYREEAVCSMAHAIPHYLSEWGRWNHPKLSDPHAAMGSPGPPPLLHDIAGHLVFVNQRDRKQALVIDGHELPYYDEVLDPHWVHEGRTLIYRARDARGAFLVIAGKEGPAYDYVGHPVFSRNGKHMAYGAIKGGRWFVVIDEQETATYEDINDRKGGLLAVSDDGRVAFAAYIGTEWRQIIDGKEGLPGLGYGQFFGKNDEHFAYVAARGAKRCVVVDGVAGKEYDRILYDSLDVVRDQVLFFAAWNSGPVPHDPPWIAVLDGQEFPLSGWPMRYPGGGDQRIFPVTRGKRTAVYYQGREGPQYDQVLSPETSTDGKRTAYAARRNSKWVAVIDGKEGPEFESIRVDRFWFTADGAHSAYVGTREGRQIAVLNGKESKPYGYIYDPAFSPDGRHHTYLVADEEKKWNDGASIVIDGKMGPRYDVIRAALRPGRAGYSQVTLWNTQGDHVAYVARMKASGDRPAEAFVVFDGQEQKRYREVRDDSLSFTADGRHLAYDAQTDDAWIHVVDGIESSAVKGWRQAISLTGKPLQYYFIRDQSLYRGVWEKKIARQ